MIACKTTIGFGLPTHAGTNKAHSDAQGAAEVAGARKNLNWTYEPFVIPDDILGAWRKAGSRGSEQREKWNQAVEALDAKQRAEFERRLRGDLPQDLGKVIDAYKQKLVAEKPEVATRKAGQAALDVIGAAVPELITSSADLTPSNNTKFADEKEITPDDFSGRYIHWGIREHGMIAACNGIAIHGGFIPSGASFFCFTDYCRPSLRLSALMGIRVVHVFTHDSIGLGEDGPTHQPVEHLAAMRAMPDFYIWRPADSVETVECWQAALEREHSPSILALTRQGLPALQTHACRGKLVRARRLRDFSGVGTSRSVDLRVRLRSVARRRRAGAIEGEGGRRPGRVIALFSGVLRAAGGLSPLGHRQREGEGRRRGCGQVRMGRDHRRRSVHRHEEFWRKRAV